MSLFKSTAIYTFGNIFTRAISFILLPLYSNLISPDEFGIYILIMAAYSIIAVFYQGGIQTGFTKFYLEENDLSKRKKIFSDVISVILMVGFLLSIILSFFHLELSKLITGNEDYSLLVLIAIWMLFFDTIFFYFQNLLRTQEKAKLASFFTILNGIINFSLNIYFVYFLQKGIYGIVISQFIANLISVVLLVKNIRTNFSFSVDKIILKKILVFSFPLFLAGLFSTFVDFADRFFIDFYLDKNSVGVYSFAYRIALIVNVFVISFRTAWTPFAINLYHKNDYEIIYGRSLIKLLALLCLIFLSVSLFANDLFELKILGKNVFNKEYFDGVKIIPVIIISYSFNALISFYSIYPYVKSKSSYFLYTDLISFIVNLILNIILIPKFGMMGAAIATMISFISGFIFLFFASRKIKIKYYFKEIILLIFITVSIYSYANSKQNILVDVISILMFFIISFFLLKDKIKFNPLFNKRN